MISDLNLPVPIRTTARNLQANRTTSFATTFFLPAANVNGAIVYGIDAELVINHNNIAALSDLTDSFIEFAHASVYIPLKREVAQSGVFLSGAGQPFHSQKTTLNLEKPVYLPPGVGFGFGIYPNNGATVSAKIFVNYELL